MKKRSFKFKIITAITWLIFTISLAGWWLTLSLEYAGPKTSMIISEGLTLIFFIFVGGVSLISYMRSEHKMRKQTEEFFASNNHEIKTYITSLRLKAEGLVSDLEGREEVFEAQKIIDDTVRLELQVENSLLLAANKQNLFKETLNLSQYFKQTSDLFSDIRVEYLGSNQSLHTDKRMFDTIVKNIVQNAKVHAKAEKVTIETTYPNKQIKLSFSNDGEPFKGELNRLGELYYRHSPSSRSGIGLYLAKRMAIQLGGDAEFELDDNEGLRTIITLKIGEDHGLNSSS